MPKYYVKWQLETTKIPADYQEMVKSRLARGEMIKADIKAGIIKDWGCAAGGCCERHYSPSGKDQETATPRPSPLGIGARVPRRHKPVCSRRERAIRLPPHGRCLDRTRGGSQNPVWH